ncbi:hypothetical protein [Mucilaginibacter dorajii]|uniref:Uncharacterized protein n=1 Tax=Mucilaginibacter dorajii TaxID=692994 RepID=A0ABP7PB62_9SPHI|nr:hypothetical protein [Mucilaginibacter dorajii]MCS3734847.1 hypothetical protein [Mucilaginibacter dorajii]
MAGTIDWKPNFDKWYKVKKESYQLVYELAKERFAEVSSESESITDKSIKMLTALVSLFGFFIGFIFKQHANNWFICVLIPIVSWDIYCLYKLLTPKESRLRGLPPSESIPMNLDSEEDQDYQLELVYYQVIVHYQNNISIMKAKNEARIVNYKLAIKLFLLILALISIFVAVLL